MQLVVISVCVALNTAGPALALGMRALWSELPTLSKKKHFEH